MGRREEVMELVRAHLSEELGIDASGIDEQSRFKEDLEADSLDLVELVMELEDRYGIRVSEEEAAEIETVGNAVDFVCARVPATSCEVRASSSSSTRRFSRAAAAAWAAARRVGRRGRR